MDWKELLRNKAVELLQDPRVSKALQDPRVTKAVVGAFQLRSQLEKSVTEKAQQIAKTLHLATAAELQELRRAVSRLERQLEQERRERAEDIAPRAMS